LYRFIEDGWAGGLGAWCEGEGESWLLIGNAGMKRWVLRKFAEAGISGTRILDADWLRNVQPSRDTRLCCVGWDATLWPDLGLLELAAATARSFEMYSPSPRLPGDAQQREWIEVLERRLGLERATCPESGFISENEALVARLEKSELASPEEARAPGLLVGVEWPDQVRLVCAQVMAWLAEHPNPGAPIGVIAPEDSATAIAVAEALESAGVCVEHPGRLREPAPAVLILEQAAQYHLSGHDIEALIELANLLWLYAPEKWSALEPERVRDALDRAFQTAQSRNSRILAQALPHREDPAWDAARNVIQALGRWDGDFDPPALREKWDALLAALRLPADTLDAWPDGLCHEGRASGRAFMEWLAGHLSARRRIGSPPDYATLAPVVVTTFADAAQQTWERLIFLDSNEHVWPAPIGEPAAAPLTRHDLRLLDEARFLDLLEHCRGPIAFAGVLTEESVAGGHAQPNDWVLRALLETTPGVFPPDLWAASARSVPPEAPPALDESERAHMERVHASRRNATMPFDRYMFNFNETQLEPEPWSATDLDTAFNTPATFALGVLFGANAREPFARAEAAAVGNRAHRWLRQILGPSGPLAAPASAAGDEAKLARELAAARRELAEWYGAEDLAMPIWWETCLRKTEWAARRCLREARGCIGSSYCAVEHPLALTVRTPGGSLPLKGRIDILISDSPEIAGARVRMFDFKTGRGSTPTLASLARGEGAQFAAYYLMARDAGAAEAVIGIIKPEERARDVFGAADEEALRARFGLLAELRRTLRFGRRGPLVSAHGVCETLPMATVPIDPAILEQKAALFLIA
jgi:hypothetical protein